MRKIVLVKTQSLDKPMAEHSRTIVSYITRPVFLKAQFLVCLLEGCMCVGRYFFRLWHEYLLPWLH